MPISDEINTIIQKLQNTKSEEEWNKVCDEVKEGVLNKTLTPPYQGEYPSWWFPKVIVSGLAHYQQMRWRTL